VTLRQGKPTVQRKTVSSQQRVHAIIDDGRFSGQQLLVIGLCFLFNMLDGFDITAMAVVAGAVGAEMAITPDRLGWIFSFALAGMMAGAMFLAPVSDIVGRRRTIIVSIALLGVSVLLTATASTLLEFVVLRFLAGLGAGAMLASQATLADEYSPDRYRALSVAIVTSGYPAGAMMTSVAAAAILPDFGWRGMFWFGGGLTLLMAVIALLMIPESLKYLLERRPENALLRINAILARLGKAALEELPDIQVTGEARRTGFMATLMKLGSREHRRVTLMLWSTFFLSFTALYFLLSWVPKLVEDAGFTAGDGRSAFFLMNLGAIIGIYTLGAFSTRLKLTNLIALFFLLSAIGMVIYAAAPAKLGLLLVIIFFVGLFQQGGFTAMYSVAAKSYPTDMRSTGIGWAIGLGRFGAVIGPAAAGYLIAGGLGIAANFVIFAIPMAVSAMLAYRLHIR
jgi:AAHS family 4-hydroxybenzoate transporter-like MFS transporter